MMVQLYSELQSLETKEQAIKTVLSFHPTLPRDWSCTALLSVNDQAVQPRHVSNGSLNSHLQKPSGLGRMKICGVHCTAIPSAKERTVQSYFRDNRERMNSASGRTISTLCTFLVDDHASHVPLYVSEGPYYVLQSLALERQWLSLDERQPPR
jgi:hypothetical protein